MRQMGGLGTFRRQRYSKRGTQRRILPDYLEKKASKGIAYERMFLSVIFEE